MSVFTATVLFSRVERSNTKDCSCWGGAVRQSVCMLVDMVDWVTFIFITIEHAILSMNHKLHVKIYLVSILAFLIFLSEPVISLFFLSGDLISSFPSPPVDKAAPFSLSLFPLSRLVYFFYDIFRYHANYRKKKRFCNIVRVIVVFLVFHWACYFILFYF